MVEIKINLEADMTEKIAAEKCLNETIALVFDGTCRENCRSKEEETMKKVLFLLLEDEKEIEEQGTYSPESVSDEEFILKKDVLKLIHETGGCDGGDPWTRGYDDSCDTLYEAVLSMKPAEVQLVDGDCGWHPADEPPTNCRDVLICYTNGDQAVAYRESGRWWLGKFFTDTVDDVDVAAWRKLPKSYSE